VGPDTTVFRVEGSRLLQVFSEYLGIDTTTGSCPAVARTRSSPPGSSRPKTALNWRRIRQRRDSALEVGHLLGALVVAATPHLDLRRSVDHLTELVFAQSQSAAPDCSWSRCSSRVPDRAAHLSA
jgi:hypothetical protein